MKIEGSSNMCFVLFFFHLIECLLIKSQITSIHRGSTTDDRQVETKLCQIVFHMYLDQVPSVYFISIYEQFWSFLEHTSISYSKFFLYTVSDQVPVLYQIPCIHIQKQLKHTQIKNIKRKMQYITISISSIIPYFC